MREAVDAIDVKAGSRGSNEMNIWCISDESTNASQFDHDLYCNGYCWFKTYSARLDAYVHAGYGLLRQFSEEPFHTIIVESSYTSVNLQT